MAILGYDTNGASTDNTDGDTVWMRWQAPAAGDAQTAVAHIWANWTSLAEIGLYSDNGASSTDPTGATRLAVAQIAGTGVSANVSVNLAIPALVSGTFYWLGFATVNPCATKYDATGAAVGYASTSSVLPDPVPTIAGTLTHRFSLWIDYVASGGGRRFLMGRQ